MASAPKAVQYVLAAAVSKANKLPKANEEYGELITESQAETILHLDLEELEALVNYSTSFITLKVNQHALNQALNNVQQLKNIKALEDNFLEHGAPFKLMKRLFGMQTKYFSKRRAKLKLKNTGTGRPQSCSEELNKKIWKAWSTHESNASETERFLFVAKTTQLDFHIIWHSLSPHIEE